MATKTAKLPKGFIELHLANTGKPVLIKVDLIGHMIPVYEVGDRRYGNEPKKVNWTHISNLSHNNGGFDVSESYEKIIEMMVKAQEAA